MNLKAIPFARRRVLAKLGPFEIDAIRTALRAGEEENALSLLEHYRDQVQKTAAALDRHGNRR